MRNFLTALFILFLLLPARVMAQGGTSCTPIGPALQSLVSSLY